MLNKKSLCFLNLPHEIEELIFYHRSKILEQELNFLKNLSSDLLFKEIKRRCNDTALEDHKQYSTYNKELINQELYHNLDSSSNSYIIHKQFINYMIYSKLCFNNLIISCNMFDKESLFILIDNNIKNKDKNKDIYDYIDNKIIDFWNNITHEEKTKQVNKIFDSVKQQYLLNNGLLVKYNKVMMGDICYNVLRNTILNRSS